MIPSEEREDEVRKKLHRDGRRMTPQRAAILKCLRESFTHPTAEEIYEEVQKRIPRISLGTVYRNLQVLVEEGYAKRIPTAQGSQRFDRNVSAHHHVVCLECGTIEDFEAEPDEALREHVGKRTGFQVTSHRTEFTGICPACGA